MIDLFSTTTLLHISLRIGLQVLYIIQAEAVKLHSEIKDQSGIYSDFEAVIAKKKINSFMLQDVPNALHISTSPIRFQLSSPMKTISYEPFQDAS